MRLSEQELRYIKEEGVIVGNKIYARCQECGKLVQVNKTLFGALHICDSEENLNRALKALKEMRKK